MMQSYTPGYSSPFGASAFGAPAPSSGLFGAAPAAATPYPAGHGLLGAGAASGKSGNGLKSGEPRVVFVPFQTDDGEPNLKILCTMKTIVFTPQTQKEEDGSVVCSSPFATEVEKPTAAEWLAFPLEPPSSVLAFPDKVHAVQAMSSLAVTIFSKSSRNSMRKISWTFEVTGESTWAIGAFVDEKLNSDPSSMWTAANTSAVLNCDSRGIGTKHKKNPTVHKTVLRAEIHAWDRKFKVFKVSTGECVHDGKFEKGANNTECSARLAIIGGHGALLRITEWSQTSAVLKRLSACNRQLVISNAGVSACNGAYAEDGDHNGQKRWLKVDDAEYAVRWEPTYHGGSYLLLKETDTAVTELYFCKSKKVASVSASTHWQIKSPQFGDANPSGGVYPAPDVAEKIVEVEPSASGQIVGETIGFASLYVTDQEYTATEEPFNVKDWTLKESGFVQVNEDTQQLILRTRRDETLWNMHVLPTQVLSSAGSVDVGAEVVATAGMDPSIPKIAEGHRLMTVVIEDAPIIARDKVEKFSVVLKKVFPGVVSVACGFSESGMTNGKVVLTMVDEERASELIDQVGGFFDLDKKHRLRLSLCTSQLQRRSWAAPPTGDADEDTMYQHKGYCLSFETRACAAKFAAAHARCHGNVLLVIRVAGQVLKETFAKSATVTDVMARISEKCGAPPEAQMLFRSAASDDQLVQINAAERLSSMTSLIRRRVGHLVCVLSQSGLKDVEMHALGTSTAEDGERSDHAKLPAEMSASLLNLMTTLNDNYRVNVGCWGTCWQALRNLSDIAKLTSQPHFAEKLQSILQDSLTAPDDIARAVCADVLFVTEKALLADETTIEVRAAIYNSVAAAVASALPIQDFESEAAGLSRQLLSVLCKAFIAQDGEMLLENKTAVAFLAFVSGELIVDPTGADRRLIECIRICIVCLRLSGDHFGPIMLSSIVASNARGKTVVRQLLEWLADRPSEESEINNGNSELRNFLLASGQSGMPKVLSDACLRLFQLLAAHNCKDEHRPSVDALVQSLVSVLFRGGSNAAVNGSSSLIVLVAKAMSIASPYVADTVACALVDRGFGYARSPPPPLKKMAKSSKGWSRALGRIKHHGVPPALAGTASTDCKCTVALVDGRAMMGEDGVELMNLLRSSISLTVPSPTDDESHILGVTVGACGVWSATMEIENDVVLETACINYSLPDPAGDAGSVESIEIYAGMSANRLVSVARHYCETTTWVDGEQTGTWTDPLRVKIPIGPAVRFVSVHIHGTVGSSISLSLLKFVKQPIDTGGSKDSTAIQRADEHGLPVTSLAAVCECTPSAVPAIVQRCNTSRLVVELLVHISRNSSTSSAEHICQAMLAANESLKEVAMMYLLSDGATGIVLSASSAEFCGKLCRGSPEYVVMLWSFVAKKINQSAAAAGLLLMVADTVSVLSRQRKLPKACFSESDVGMEATLEALVECSKSSGSKSLAVASKRLVCTLMDLTESAHGAVSTMLLAQADAAADHREATLLATWRLASNLVDARPNFAASLMELFEGVAAFVARTVRDGLDEADRATIRSLQVGLLALSAACHAGVGKPLVAADNLLVQVVGCFARVHIGSSGDADDGQSDLDAALRNCANAALGLVYAAWNQSPENRQAVMQAMHQAVNDASHLEYFVAKLVIDCREYGDVVHVVVDDTHMRTRDGTIAASGPGIADASNSASIMKALHDEDDGSVDAEGDSLDLDAGPISIESLLSAEIISTRKKIKKVQSGMSSSKAHNLKVQLHGLLDKYKKMTGKDWEKGAAHKAYKAAKKKIKKGKKAVHALGASLSPAMPAAASKSTPKTFAQLWDSMPAFTPKLSYTGVGASYAVSPKTTLAEIMLLHGYSSESWYVHTKGERRERIHGMLTSAGSLCEKSVGDCVRLSISPHAAIESGGSGTSNVDAFVGGGGSASSSSSKYVQRRATAVEPVIRCPVAPQHAAHTWCFDSVGSSLLPMHPTLLFFPSIFAFFFFLF